MDVQETFDTFREWAFDLNSLPQKTDVGGHIDHSWLHARLDPREYPEIYRPSSCRHRQQAAAQGRNQGSQVGRQHPARYLRLARAPRRPPCGRGRRRMGVRLRHQETAGRRDLHPDRARRSCRRLVRRGVDQHTHAPVRRQYWTPFRQRRRNAVRFPCLSRPLRRARRRPDRSASGVRISHRVAGRRHRCRRPRHRARAAGHAEGGRFRRDHRRFPALPDRRLRQHRRAPRARFPTSPLSPPRSTPSTTRASP